MPANCSINCLCRKSSICGWITPHRCVYGPHDWTDPDPGADSLAVMMERFREQRLQIVFIADDDFQEHMRALIGRLHVTDRAAVVDFDANGFLWAIDQAMILFNQPTEFRSSQVQRIMTDSLARFDPEDTARRMIDLIATATIQSLLWLAFLNGNFFSYPLLM